MGGEEYGVFLSQTTIIQNVITWLTIQSNLDCQNPFSQKFTRFSGLSLQEVHQEKIKQKACH